MYKNPWAVYQGLVADRRKGLDDITNQFRIIASTIDNFYKVNPSLRSKEGFLCGSEISLADATLFPTAVFANYMLPQFFNIPQSSFFLPVLAKWFEFMSKEVNAAAEVRNEIEIGLDGWKTAKRWDPIILELKNI